MPASPVIESVQTYTFVSVVSALIEGHKIHKLEWANKEYYGLLRFGKLQLHKPDGQYYDWVLSEGDLIGNDWIILTPAPKIPLH